MSNGKEVQNLQEQLQQKMIAYRSLKGRVESLLQQQQMFSEKIAEINNTIKGIEEIQKGKGNKDVLFPLGSAAQVRGKVKEGEKIIVQVGGGVGMEKAPEEAKDVLKKRSEELDNATSILQGEIERLSEDMQEMEMEAQRIAMKAQQQQGKFGVVSPE